MAQYLRVLALRSLPAARRSLSTTAAVKNTTEPEMFVEDGPLPAAHRDVHYPWLGNRDVVGFGLNGLPTYMDHLAVPAPAIRFRENSHDVMALREKEKGDWSALTMEEKKDLYRASFCQTYSEQLAPTGEWKSIVAIVCGAFIVTGWFMIFMKKFVYTELPPTITEEWKQICLDRMIDQGQGRIEGIASRYDYENNRWK